MVEPAMFASSALSAAENSHAQASQSVRRSGVLSRRRRLARRQTFRDINAGPLLCVYLFLLWMRSGEEFRSKRYVVNQDKRSYKQRQGCLLEVSIT